MLLQWTVWALSIRSVLPLTLSFLDLFVSHIRHYHFAIWSLHARFFLNCFEAKNDVYDEENRKD